MTSDALLESFRPAIAGHCYRMLGSVMDADDAVQETMFRAWRGKDRFAGSSSLQTWLYRIATNVCLDALSSRAARMRVLDLAGPGTVDDPLTQRPREQWVEPAPDAWAIPADGDPAERAILRESIRLAFVAALQYLPPRQRAVLLLTQVLNWSAAEVAGTLEMSVAAVNSALQRARATLAERNVKAASPKALDSAQAELVRRYVEAFEQYDVPALTALMHEDATLSMPPYELWLQGHDAIATWFLGHGAGCRGSRLVPTQACGAPAFAQYRRNGAEPWALVVLDIEGGRISGQCSFLDTATLFPKFGMPMTL